MHPLLLLWQLVACAGGPLGRLLGVLLLLPTQWLGACCCCLWEWQTVQPCLLTTRDTAGSCWHLQPHLLVREEPHHHQHHHHPASLPVACAHCLPQQQKQLSAVWLVVSQRL